MRFFIIEGLIFLVTATVPGAASAQCTSNADCKGGRICQAGRCVDVEATRCGKDTDCPGDQVCRAGACGAAAAPPPLPAAVPGAAPAGRAAAVVLPTASLSSPRYAQPTVVSSVDPGWAFTAGILGTVSAVLVLSTGIGAEVVGDDDTEAAIGIGATGALILGVMGPVVVAGSGSARRSPGVDGIPALRISGWVGYGLALMDALVAIGLAAGDVVIPDGVPAALGGLGMLSMVSFSIDAFVANNQARRAARRLTTNRPRFSMLPTVTPVRLADGSSTGVFGLTGRF
jgi:Cys-rich repeat protein